MIRKLHYASVDWIFTWTAVSAILFTIGFLFLSFAMLLAKGSPAFEWLIYLAGGFMALSILDMIVATVESIFLDNGRHHGPRA